MEFKQKKIRKHGKYQIAICLPKEFLDTLPNYFTADLKIEIKNVKARDRDNDGGKR